MPERLLMAGKRAGGGTMEMEMEDRWSMNSWGIPFGGSCHRICSPDATSPPLPPLCSPRPPPQRVGRRPSLHTIVPTALWRWRASLSPPTALAPECHRLTPYWKPLNLNKGDRDQTWTSEGVICMPCRPGPIDAAEFAPSQVRRYWGRSSIRANC